MTGPVLMREPRPIYRIDAFTDRVFGALVIAATLAAAGPAPGAALGAELTVEVVGLRSDDGNVHFALYDDPATFPDDEGRLRGTNVPIAGRRAVAVDRVVATARQDGVIAAAAVEMALWSLLGDRGVVVRVTGPADGDPDSDQAVSRMLDSISRSEQAAA